MGAPCEVGDAGARVGEAATLGRVGAADGDGTRVGATGVGLGAGRVAVGAAVATMGFAVADASAWPGVRQVSAKKAGAGGAVPVGSGVAVPAGIGVPRGAARVADGCGVGATLRMRVVVQFLPGPP